MNRVVGRDVAARPLGVIDTLTAGYEAVNRRLWLVLLPIALDLLFWLGPKLSIVRLGGYLPLDLVSLDQAPMATAVLAHLNLFSLLALYVPTVLGRWLFEPLNPFQPGGQRSVLQLVPETLPITLAVLMPLALLVAALYLGQLGQVILPSPFDSGGVRRLVRHWWRLIVVHLGGLVAFLCLTVPAVLLMATAGRLVSRELAGFLLVLFQVTLLWLGFYFFFALGATILNEGNPLRAALSSVSLVRSNFWAAVALVGLSLVIDTGLSIIWRTLSSQAERPALAVWGLLASIVANAYIGTGLAAAAMVFYRDRFLHPAQLERSSH